MMKKLALLTMMVLGSTSIASAGSFRTNRYERSPQTTTVRDHRGEQSWNGDQCNEPRYNLTGDYVSPAGNVRLVQRGNRISGTFANGGQMNGVIKNGMITYAWTEGGYHGRGYWYLDGNGALEGMWGANESNTSGGYWNLTLA